MRFIVDVMLGTLTKWLRVLGFDVLYAIDCDDDEILSIAEKENRLIISRDRELCGRKADSILLETTDLDAQLTKVLELHPPCKNDILTRCLECNSVLLDATRAEASENVPEGVLLRHETFWKCPGCGKYYWAGTHWQAMMKKAAELSVSRNSLH